MRKLWPLLLVAALFYANRSCERPPWLGPLARNPSPTPDAWASGSAPAPTPDGWASGPVREYQAAPKAMVEQNRNTGSGGLSASGAIGAARQGLNRR